MDASNEIAVPARASVQRPAATILVCDDDRLVLVTLSAALRSAGYSVIEAENGDEAILLARQYRPDLAVLDIRMDGKSGLDVAAYLRDYVGTPFMFLSAFSDEAFIRQARDFGAIEYLVKPIDIERMAPVVERALAMRAAGRAGGATPSPSRASAPALPAQWGGASGGAGRRRTGSGTRSPAARCGRGRGCARGLCAPADRDRHPDGALPAHPPGGRAAPGRPGEAIRPDGRRSRRRGGAQHRFPEHRVRGVAPAAALRFCRPPRRA